MTYSTLTESKISVPQLIMLTDMQRKKTTNYYIPGTWGALVHKGLVELSPKRSGMRLALSEQGEHVTESAHDLLKQTLAETPDQLIILKGKKVVVATQETKSPLRFLSHLGFFLGHHHKKQAPLGQGVSLCSGSNVFSTTEKFEEVVMTAGFKNRKYVF